MTSTTDLRGTEGRVTRFFRWGLAALFLVAGGGKLLGLDSAQQMFEDFGYSQDFRVVIGVLETAGALGLLIPRLAFWAALGLGGIMVGAIVTHIVHDPLYMALPPFVVLLLLAKVALQKPQAEPLKRQMPRHAT